jgi:hypothetical protein
MTILVKANYRFIAVLSIFHYILHRNRTDNPNIHMEAQKTLNSQINPEQKREMVEELQCLISNYSIEHNNKNSIVLVQQTHRPLE